MSRLAICLVLLTALFSALSPVLCLPVSSAGVLETRSRHGRGTWFEVGLGNCGKRNKDSDWIVALATSTYAHGSHCGKKIHISSGGKTAVATVRDSCQSCHAGDLDMSPSLFRHFAPQSRGVIPVNWYFM